MQSYKCFYMLALSGYCVPNYMIIRCSLLMYSISAS